MRAVLILLSLLKTLTLCGQQNSGVQPFLPEIFINYTNIRDFTISANEDEAFFTLQSPLAEISVILMIEKEKGHWSEPDIAPFSGEYVNLEPFLSPDGLKLYFASNRPVEKTEKKKDFDIWYVERSSKEDAWSVPINMGDIINSAHDEFYPAVSKANNLYFTTFKPDAKRRDDIYICKWENNAYSQPVPLSDSINTQGSEFNAYISPDDSFIIFSSWNRKDGIGGGDLYISFKDADNHWSNAQNLGSEINSKYVDYCPFVNVNTGTLYFTSRRSELRQEQLGFTSYQELMKAINKYQNGYSRIYNVDISEIIVNK